MKPATWLALGAIGMWSTLAALGVALSHVPPFLLTGLALLVGSVIAFPLSRFDVSQWRVPAGTLALGVYGLFGFHFLLFLALRYAPPVEANLINYLWPLGMVVLAPVFLPGTRLHVLHVVASTAGFAGAVLAILGRPGSVSADAGFQWGYVLAFASAFVWASYSLLTQRVKAFPTAAIGSFAAASGVLSLLCHAWLEPATSLSLKDVLLIAVMGLGPLGGAFFLWDAALKRADARHIGLLSFLTPLLSTLLLLVVKDQQPGWHIVVAAVLIVGAAVLGTRIKSN